MSNKKSDTPLTIGEKLTDLRKKKEETQDQVATETNISKATLSNYENNNNFAHEAHIRLDYLCKLAKHYGVSISDLLGNSADIELVASYTETENIPEQFPSNNLIDVFEDAVDKYHIAEFLNYDITYTPLHKSFLDSICEFICELQRTLPKFRRKQDSIFLYINDFINTMREYLGYLGENMYTDDGKIFNRLCNIDLKKFQDNTIFYLTRLNEIYGLISNGGTFAFFRV